MTFTITVASNVLSRGRFEGPGVCDENVGETALGGADAGYGQAIPGRHKLIHYPALKRPVWISRLLSSC